MNEDTLKIAKGMLADSQEVPVESGLAHAVAMQAIAAAVIALVERLDRLDAIRMTEHEIVMASRLRR